MSTLTASKVKAKDRRTTETTPAADDQAREKLIAARIALLIKAPFFGHIAMRLKLTNADAWSNTAATDGRHLYYNTSFVNELPAKQVEFLVAHEVLHVVYDHLGRRGHREPRLSNVAADYCVNADCIDQNIGQMIPDTLYESKYSGMSYEEVYDDLEKNVTKMDLDDLVQKILDEHLDGDDDGEGDEGDSEDGNGSGGKRPKLSKEDMKQLRDEVREAVINAANATSPDKVPAGVRRLISQLTNPQLNWRELIRQQIQSLVKSDYSFMRPSRRSWHMDAILPGSNFAETIDVCIAIDASGSMSDGMLRDILSEIKGIMESYDNFKLKIWSFDTAVYGLESFSPENLDEIDSYEVQGGGGTDFDANWQFMKDNVIEPKLFIMFTDGYPYNSWGDENYCDTLFVIHGSTTIESPFGQTAYYDLAKGS